MEDNRLTWTVLVLWSQVLWLVIEGTSHLYPFGLEAGDIALPFGDDAFEMFNLTTPVNFYGQPYDSVFVNLNGMVTFEGENFVFRGALAPFPWNANTSEPQYRDLSDHIIAPFMEDLLPNGMPPGNNIVYSRQSTDQALLDQATADVRAAFPCQADFEADWVFVATWDEVQHYYYYYEYCYSHPDPACVASVRAEHAACLAACESNANTLGCTGDCEDDLLDDLSTCSEETCLNYNEGDEDLFNTFQVVLATGGTKTFAFFNYEDLQWLTSEPDNDYAQVGFNHGDGLRAHLLPGSLEVEVGDLATTSNVGVPGRHAFRVDLPFIKAESCQPGACICQFGGRQEPPFTIGSSKVPALEDFAGNVQGFKAKGTIVLAEFSDESDPCRFRLEATVRFKKKEFRVANAIFSFGIGNQGKYLRNLKLGSSRTVERGQGIDVNMLNLTAEAYTFSEPGLEVTLVETGGLMVLQSSTCAWELEYQRRATPRDVITLYAGSGLEGPFEGACGSCQAAA